MSPPKIALLFTHDWDECDFFIDYLDRKNIIRKNRFANFDGPQISATISLTRCRNTSGIPLKKLMAWSLTCFMHSTKKSRLRKRSPG